MKKLTLLMPVIFAISSLIAQEKQGTAASSAQEIADKLSNPVANLISLPLQSNVDYGIGAHNGARYTLNVQPVIPVHLSPNWNLIARVVLPVIDQRDVTGEGNHEFGLSDATVTGFFAPSNSRNGFMWGFGPAFLVPTGTNDFLTTKKWGIGPSALVIKQVSGLTFGFLVNQLWSFAGDENRSDVNQMFLQPFFAKNFKSGAGLGVNAEITSNWIAHTTLATLNPIVTAVTRIGGQTISMAVGPRIPLSGPDELRAKLGLRGVLIFVFPK